MSLGVGLLEGQNEVPHISSHVKKQQKHSFFGILQISKHLLAKI